MASAAMMSDNGAPLAWDLAADRGDVSNRLGLQADELRMYRRGGATYDLAYCIPSRQGSARRAEQPGLHWPALPATAWLSPSGVEHGDEPYPYLVGRQPLPTETADRLVDWLDGIDRWTLNDGGFFSAYECNLLAMPIPPALRELFSKESFDALEQQASTLFGYPLRLAKVLAAHRMEPGQGIGIHTDEPRPGEETHRILLLLCRNESSLHGGHFILLQDRAPASARRLVPLVHNTVIAFPLTAASYHAVTCVTAGIRYSVVFSFHGCDER